MIDREKVLKGLECCRAISGYMCRECPYCDECHDIDLPYGMPHLAGDALELLKEQQETINSLQHTINALNKGLAEQPEIVRCKDCKYATMTIDGELCKYCEMETDDDGFLIEVYHDADWYCPWGEVKQDG